MEKKSNYESSYSLELVQNIIHEVSAVLKVRSGLLKEFPTPEAFLIISCLLVGGILIFCSQYCRGTVIGLITACNTAVFTLVGVSVSGGKAMGIIILATSIVALVGVLSFIVYKVNNIILRLEKRRLYNLAQQRQQAIINELGTTPTNANEREEYLNGLYILLQQSIKKLKEDLDNYENKCANHDAITK